MRGFKLSPDQDLSEWETWICPNGELGFVRIGPLVNAQPVTAISVGPCPMKSGPGISLQKLSLRPEFVSTLEFVLKT